MEVLNEKAVVLTAAEIDYLQSSIKSDEVEGLNFKRPRLACGKLTKLRQGLVSSLNLKVRKDKSASHEQQSNILSAAEVDELLEMVKEPPYFQPDREM